MTNDYATVQEIGEDLVVIIPNRICEKLDIKEGSEVILEPFFCNGESGIRIKLKTQ